MYIRGRGFKVSVEIFAPEYVQSGEWVPLRASRRSGPWVVVPRWRALFSFHRARRKPPCFEPEIGLNVHWQTDPPLAAQFNVGPVPVVKDPLARAVRFSQKGIYRLWGTVATPARATSNVLTIEVG